MKKVNSIIIATIIATFVFSMFAFQPTETEASNNVSPLASATPRKIRKMPRRQTIEVENDETHRTKKTVTKVKTKKPNGFTEVSGLTMEASRKNPRRKSAQYNPKELGIDKIKPKKPTSFTAGDGRSLDFELRRKHPRKRKH